jgi:ribosome-associated heat shock protein Hsp15
VSDVDTDRRAANESVRLDVWLDVSCLFKTRSEAQRACKGGKVQVNGVSAKPHRELRVGDQLVITRPLGRRQAVVVAALADTHLPKADARLLYEDRTPPPTPAEVEARRLERIFRATTIPAGRPDKRDRRELMRRKRGA